MNIGEIIEAIREDRVRITDHAYEEASADQLTFDEIYLSVFDDEIIEEYLDDDPYPSCLISGQTFSGNPVHSVWAYNPENGWAVLITVYRPDPSLWINYCKRRS